MLAEVRKSSAACSAVPPQPQPEQRCIAVDLLGLERIHHIVFRCRLDGRLKWLRQRPGRRVVQQGLDFEKSFQRSQDTARVQILSLEVKAIDLLVPTAVRQIGDRDLVPHRAKDKPDDGGLLDPIVQSRKEQQTASACCAGGVRSGLLH